MCTMHYCFPCFFQQHVLLDHPEETLFRRIQLVWWLFISVSEGYICDVIPLLFRCIFLCLPGRQKCQLDGLCIDVRTQHKRVFLIFSYSVLRATTHVEASSPAQASLCDYTNTKRALMFPPRISSSCLLVSSSTGPWLLMFDWPFRPNYSIVGCTGSMFLIWSPICSMPYVTREIPARYRRAHVWFCLVRFYLTTQ